LTNPETLIPGQRMGYSMDNAQDRENVVAYLATLKLIK
jgi:cytochrome c